MQLIIPLFWFAQYVYASFLTPHLQSMGLDSTMAGMIVGAYGFSQMILRIPLGILADKLQNHKLFVVIGMFLAGVSSLGLYLFPSSGLLLLANALSGAASSTWLSFTLIYASANTHISEKKSISRSNALNNLGILASYILGGLIAQKSGIQPLFLCSLGAGLLGMLLAFFIPKTPVERPPVHLRDLLQVFREKTLLYNTLFATAGQFMAFATAMSFTSSAAVGLGASGLLLGICSALYTAGGLCGSLFSGSAAAHRLTPRRLLPMAFGGFLLYCIGVAAVPSVWLLLPLQVLGGFSANSVFSTAMSDSIAHVPPEKKATALGFFQSVYGLGMFLGPIATGALWPLGRTAAFLAVGLVPLLFVLFTLLWGRKQKRTG